MKYHIGCGTVYLRGYTNLDIKTPTTFLAKDRPDLVEQYITDDANYYARHSDESIRTLRAGPRLQEYVCDQYLNDIGWFAYAPWGEPVEEILMRHIFEHFSIREARYILRQCWITLAHHGILRIDVPDHEETLRLLMETRDPFYIRHLLGPRRSEHGYHMMSYTPERLKALAESFLFSFVGEEPNIHFYPAFCLRFRKELSNATNPNPGYLLPGVLRDHPDQS